MGTAALTASELRYRRLFESAHDGILIVDPGTRRIIDANPFLVQLTGYAYEDFIGRELFEIGLLKDEAASQAAFQELKVTGHIRYDDLPLQTRDGRSVAVEFVSNLYQEGDQQVIQCNIRDISARKHSEEELRWKTAFLEAQVNASLDGILVVTPEGEKALQNQQMIELFRIPPQIADDKDEGKLLQWVTGQMKAPELFADTIRYLSVHPDETSRDELELKDGTILDRYSSPVVGKEGKHYGRIWTFRDITERKRAEETLRQSEERFSGAFEHAPIGVALLSPEGRWLRVNRAFCELVGYTRAEMLTRSFHDITHPGDLAADREVMRRLLAGESDTSGLEKRYIHQSGRIVTVLLSASLVRDQLGHPRYFIAQVQDITERRRLDEHSRQAQKMEALGRFSGGVAHDFNNILAAINGYTELSRMILRDNPEVRRHLDAIQHSAHRAADLVRQILAFSREQTQERLMVDLRPVVAESIKLLRVTIPTTIEFEIQLAADAPAVLANVNQVHQMLMNLGINAWHAMADRAGRLQIGLERCQVDAAQAQAEPQLRPGLYACVSVRDTGCGMDAATLRKIFEPFFTTKQPGQGTGLGLSVVHGIMSSHDGAVTVRSTPGAGTVFHLYFPATTGEVKVVPPEDQALLRGRGERILVVDDEASVASMMQEVLLKLGYEADVVNLPETALTKVRADPQRYALVLTDQSMPGMTGTTLAGQLQLIRPGLPIILMTGYNASLTAEQIKSLGIHQLLLKPTSFQVLGAAVHAALARPAPT